MIVVLPTSPKLLLLHYLVKSRSCSRLAICKLQQQIHTR